MAAEIVIHSRKKVIFTNLTQYELFQEESDLIKAGLYFSIPQDKIRKSEIFTTFEKIHRSFLNNLKSEETKSQINAHLSHLANSYFCNDKPSPRILRQHRVLQNFRNAIEEIEYDKLHPSDSAPARIYGTPKMHKFPSSDSLPKHRPIVSPIGTFNYNLARFLFDLLSPSAPNDYSCKDTFSFVSQFKYANLSQKFLVSCDVL